MSAVPDRVADHATCEVRCDIPRIGDGSEQRDPRQDQFVDQAEDDPVMHDFEDCRREIVTPNTKSRLQSQDDRQQQRQAEQIVEVAVREPVAYVGRLEQPPVSAVEGDRRDENGIG